MILKNKLEKKNQILKRYILACFLFKNMYIFEIIYNEFLWK